MIKIIKYSPDKFDEWNCFVKSAKNPLFMHDRNYMDYHQDRFTDYSLMFYNDNVLIALLPANIHGTSLISHGGLTYGGFITSDSMKQEIMCECVSVLCDYCKISNIKTLIYKVIPYIYHLQPAYEDIYALFMNGATIEKIEASTVIQIKNPIPMATLRKRQIKKAIKNQLKVIEYTDFSSYQEYIELLGDVLLKNHGVNPVHTADELFLLHSNFPDNIHLFMIKLDNTPISGTIIFEYPSLIHTQYLASNETGRQRGALDLIISFILEKYSYKEYLDFGISTEKNGTFLNKGLISQKEGFGGRTIPYVTMRIDFNE